MKTAICLGGNGFIGHHIARKLKSERYHVTVVDIKNYEYGNIDYADRVIIGDLRDLYFVKSLNIKSFDYVIQMAADMGGAEYIFTGANDANVMHNSCMINLNVCESLKNSQAKIFYSSSACIYPQHIQTDSNNPGLKESDAYPAYPDSPYGWEKIFSEILYESFYRNYQLDIRIGRFHNVFGEESCYNNGKEKAPAAIARKVCEAKDRGEIEILGDGKQTRSFLYIDEAVEGVLRCMESDCIKPINIGSNEMVSINDLAKMLIDISGKKLTIKNIPSTALGVRGRNSDNSLIREKLEWNPNKKLYDGLVSLYNWVDKQING